MATPFHVPPGTDVDYLWFPDFSEDDQRQCDAFENGDKGALLHTLCSCFQTDRMVPEWARQKFVEAMLLNYQYAIRSWDEVFGPPVDKGTRLSDARRRQKLAPLVWHKVCVRHEAGEPLNKELFEAVGEELGCGGTLAYELFDETRKIIFET